VGAPLTVRYMHTPNFEALANEMVDVLRQTQGAAAIAITVDYLHKMWNARGAADIAKVEAELSQQMGATASGPYTKNLDRALRRLDA
jgi:hypothetical protein